jgi:hypothetical protein
MSVFKPYNQLEMQVQVVVLQTKGDSKQSKLDLQDDEDKDALPQKIAKILRKTKLPTKITSWDWAKFKLELWGYKEGRTGTENKHELPPPAEGIQIYGDAVVVAMLEAGDLTNFTTAQYTKFYTQIYQGLDSDNESESDNDASDEEEPNEEEDIEVGIEEDEEVEVEEKVVEEDLDAEEDEEIKPVVKREYAANRNKKIPKWAMATELEPEEYLA